MTKEQDLDLEWKEESIESNTILNVSPPVLPPEAKLIKNYDLVNVLAKKSFHSISKYIRTTDDGITGYFFKEGKKGSNRSILEAISAGFSKLIAPEHTAATWAVYNDQYQCIGVLSEEIPNFVPASTSGLKSDDLAPMPLKDIPTFEILYEQFMELENKRNALQRKELKIDRIKEMIRYYVRMNDVSSTAAQAARNDMAKLMKDEQENFLAQVEVSEEVESFYKSIAQEYTLTKEQFDSYRVLKGFAIAFVSAILNQDADFHYNNFTNYGVRFDFDMTLWPILYDYKEDYSKYLRMPHDDMFRLSVDDVIHFPNLKNAFPYYWPTSATPNFSDEYLRRWVPEFSFSQNSYPKEETTHYQNLEYNKVFIWHKYATLLRYLLTTPEMYKAIILQHLFMNQRTQGIMSRFILNQETQQAYLRNLLVRIPEFQSFFKKYGSYVMDKHIASLEKENKGNMYDLAAVKQQYDNIIRLIDNTTGMDFHDLREQVIARMQGYVRSGRSIFRNHASLAKGIISYCTLLNPDPLDAEAVDKSISDLYEHLSGAKASVHTSGEMQKTLNSLISQLENLMEVSEQRKSKQELCRVAV
ncbi:MAG: hypothetical protein SFW66_09455 [Gammaproteobacteria bacterium]|nr:hypothetical protein [Gammaproteobacteria bacterium]